MGERGTTRRDLGVFVSVTTSSPETRARVPRTRSNFAPRSMSGQCKASATTFDLDEYVYETPSLGASGFVLKDDPCS